MEILKQSTDATIKLGPFLDDTDGKTPETTLNIVQADIRLTKNGGAFAQTNNDTGGTHDAAGWYGIPFDTTDTNTLGRLKLSVHKDGALPRDAEFMVVTANIYDSLCSNDVLQADVTQFSGVAESLIDRILSANEIRQASINDVSASTTKFDTTLTESSGFWNRSAMRFTSGNNEGLIRRIKNYSDSGDGKITIQTPLHAAPADGDTFTIIAVRAFLTPDIEDIGDQVCDELLSEHPTDGSLAKTISDIMSNVAKIKSITGFIRAKLI